MVFILDQKVKILKNGPFEQSIWIRVGYAGWISTRLSSGTRESDAVWYATTTDDSTVADEYDESYSDAAHSEYNFATTWSSPTTNIFYAAAATSKLHTVP